MKGEPVMVIRTLVDERRIATVKTEDGEYEFDISDLPPLSHIGRVEIARYDPADGSTSAVEVRLTEPEPYVCVQCHRRIVDEPRGNNPGGHDPAYHVAHAYHIQRKDGMCWSCGKPYPCPTMREFA
jgi:hypothetical protein